MKLQVGRKYKIYYGKNHLMNDLIHICAIVDHQVIYRVWRENQERWSYRLDSIYPFTVYYKQNILFDAGTTELSSLAVEIDLEHLSKA